MLLVEERFSCGNGCPLGCSPAFCAGRWWPTVIYDVENFRDFREQILSESGTTRSGWLGSFYVRYRVTPVLILDGHGRPCRLYRFDYESERFAAVHLGDWEQ